jgi:hypothetical protein
LKSGFIDLNLTSDTWGRETCLFLAVIVDREALDDRVDPIPIPLGQIAPLDDHHARTVVKGRSRG